MYIWLYIYNDPEVDRILYIFNPVTEKKTIEYHLHIICSMANKRKMEYLDDGPCNDEKMVDRISIKTVDRIFNQQSRLLPPQIQTTGNWWLVSVMWVFPTIGVYRGTQKRWIIIENPIWMDDLGGFPYFWKTPMYVYISHKCDHLS